MSDELAKAVSQHVEQEVKLVRESLDKKLEERMDRIWKELDQKYRSRIVMVLSIALAIMVGGFSVSAITATREANSAVIEFQNTIMARQKAMIDSEDLLSVAVQKLSLAETKHTIAREKLESARADLVKVTVDLAEAKRKYEELYNKLSAQKPPSG